MESISTESGTIRPFTWDVWCSIWGIGIKSWSYRAVSALVYMSTRIGVIPLVRGVYLVSSGGRRKLRQ